MILIYELQNLVQHVKHKFFWLYILIELKKFIFQLFTIFTLYAVPETTNQVKEIAYPTIISK